MNCTICRRIMILLFGSTYECRYCGHVAILKANHVVSVSYHVRCYD